MVYLAPQTTASTKTGSFSQHDSIRKPQALTPLRTPAVLFAVAAFLGLVALLAVASHGTTPQTSESPPAATALSRTCHKDTGATCRWTACWSYRNAICVNKKCICKEKQYMYKNTCADDGKCVPETAQWKRRI